MDIRWFKTPFTDIVQKTKLIIEVGDLGILQKIFLKEKMAHVNNDIYYVLHFLLEIDENGSPVTYDESVHVTRSLAKMVDLLEGQDIEIHSFDHKQLVDTIQHEEQLITDEVRNKFISTFYSLVKWSNPLLARAVLEVLEKISNGLLAFERFGSDDRKLYQKIYVCTLMMYFGFSMDTSKKFFLRSPFLIYAVQVGFDVHVAVKDYIRSYLTVFLRENLSLNFASDLAINKTKIGKMLGGAEVTVEDWIKMLKEGIEKKEIESREYVVESLDKNPNILANLEYNQVVIKQIILLYYDLVAGNFILEDDGFEPVEKIMQEMAKEQGIDLEAEQKEHALSFDTQLDLHINDFDTWILENDTQGSLFTWLEDYSTSDAKHKALVNLFITKHISLESEENISALLQLTDYLKQNGFTDDHDLIYFNSQTNQFEWNK